ncbi:MAG: UvrD-helicase domain-containing protein [Patescibacteria group bacterium]|jgi:hypothetical protein
MSDFDHKTERQGDIDKIKNSIHPRKIIVAGPGTGKSFLFQELIKAKKIKGKTDFIAITFIGKLGDALADDLCGLAETMTMHGFARKFLLNNSKRLQYYPRIYEIIKEDLRHEKVKEFEIGDEKYKDKSNYYNAVGDADVVYYAVQECKKDNNKIPVHDLILIDEFQDFNEIESEFIDLLSLKNEIVIVGDDDQALYEFKGSSPDHIRKKYDVVNTDFESHTLRFCSRCTEVIIKYFHAIVEKFNLNDPAKSRIKKDYICYLPDKKSDSDANAKIHLIKKCPPGMIAYKIKEELKKIIRDQKVKEVLIIGEGKSCRTILENIARQLCDKGFKNVECSKNEGILNFKQDVVDAYKFIHKDVSSVLGWRILGNPTDQGEIEQHIKNSKVLNNIINGTPSEIKAINDKKMESLEKEIGYNDVTDKKVRKKVLVKELKKKNVNLSRPLGNLNITVCNTLNSKGLGADVVFVVGFDQGKFPAKSVPTESEIYQILVALTRAKKRIYFINTIGKRVSSFADCLDAADFEMQEIIR